MCNNVVKVCNKGPTIFFCPVNVTHVYKTITYNLEYMTSHVPFYTLIFRINYLLKFMVHLVRII